MKEKLLLVWNELKTFVLVFVKSSKFKTFLWQTLNGFVILLVASLDGVKWVYVPMLLAVLNYITKYINTVYLKK